MYYVGLDSHRFRLNSHAFRVYNLKIKLSHCHLSTQLEVRGREHDKLYV